MLPDSCLLSLSLSRQLAPSCGTNQHCPPSRHSLHFYGNTKLFTQLVVVVAVAAVADAAVVAVAVVVAAVVAVVVAPPSQLSTRELAMAIAMC